ncbi:type-1 angiotensin II receptor-associated protein isoform X2 [Sceloporus undulatus]|uniref:type-1 angiotensin II receptor-associated protein isoform X2 n=1 Tax=Sceloporus undulatus TaxID=8520 RepID=UPI001C4D5539|nr:type-1 angiotensin II receptor-associated protein isoform X2 [Sceloporus undulatus]
MGGCTLHMPLSPFFGEVLFLPFFFPTPVALKRRHSGSAVLPGHPLSRGRSFSFSIFSFFFPSLHPRESSHGSDWGGALRKRKQERKKGEKRREEKDLGLKGRTSFLDGGASSQPKGAAKKRGMRAIILVHWLLTIWGSMELWLPSSYSWSNFTVFALGVWAVAQRDSVDAILMTSFTSASFIPGTKGS